MRWLLIALFVIGAAFVALMIFAPDRGHWTKGDPLPKTPGWTKGLGSLVSGFAPGVERFSDGTTSVSIAKDSSETRDVSADEDTETRILKLRLKSGGPVVLKLDCRFSPNAECGEVQVLCLGSRVPDSGCDDQEDVTNSGSFSVTAGGGSLRFDNDTSQAAVVEID
jgi:hypothetical protein